MCIQLVSSTLCSIVFIEETPLEAVVPEYTRMQVVKLDGARVIR